MKLCDTCIYRNNVEQLKPCIIYRDDCEYYMKERDMTSDDAVSVIKRGLNDHSIDCFDIKQYMAIDMAIKALEQEYCTDAISRQAVFDAIEELKKIHFDRVVVLNKVRDRVLDLPSVNPQEPKTGHWSRKTKVDAYDIAGVKTWGIKCQCDRCDFTTIVVEDFGYYKYCPNCGADMRGDTE